MFVVKLDGTREEFSTEKLKSSMQRAGASPEAADEIVSHIEKEVHEGMTTSFIYKHALKLLRKKESMPVAARYSLRRAVLDLGPSGFPFEQLLAQMLKKKGYQTEVGQTLRGKCVEHEIDVVAKKDDELILVEAKFHNAQGFKTDVKVAMYVHARFLDLQDSGYDGMCPDGGTCHPWLVTNTKFTRNAIDYGKCSNLKLIGWNYPKQGNLQDLIEETKLHPVSCLTTLTKKEKDSLYQQGFVLCKNVTDNPNILKTAGLTGKKVDNVLQEARHLCV